MKIAAIDPGGTTGLAIAEFVETPLEIRLRKKTLLSLDDPSTVLAHVLILRCVLAVMEDQPLHGSLEGRRPFEVIHDSLIRSGFRLNKNVVSSFHPSLMLLKPGVWKPFVRAQSPDLMEWEPESQHEKDALSILWYSTQIRHPKKHVWLEK